MQPWRCHPIQSLASTTWRGAAYPHGAARSLTHPSMPKLGIWVDPAPPSFDTRSRDRVACVVGVRRLGGRQDHGHLGALSPAGAGRRIHGLRRYRPARNVLRRANPGELGTRARRRSWPSPPEGADTQRGCAQLSTRRRLVHGGARCHGRRSWGGDRPRALRGHDHLPAACRAGRVEPAAGGARQSVRLPRGRTRL